MSVVLFCAWTWHHSKNNRTDRIRRAFVVDTTAYNAILTPALNEVWNGAKPARTAIPPLVPQLNAVLAQG